MSTSKPRGHVPIIPEYKWGKYSEDIADRNASSRVSRRSQSRGSDYTGLAVRPADLGLHQTSLAGAERIGRSRHRPNRSIDIIEYSQLRASQESAERSRLGLAGKEPASASRGAKEHRWARRSVDANAGDTSRPASRGETLRNLVSSLSHWPQQPLFEKSRHRSKSITASTPAAETATERPRPATSHAKPQRKPDESFASLNQRPPIPMRVRSRSLEARRTLQLERQRQALEASPPAKYAQPPHTKRHSSQSNIQVPARSSSLTPAPAASSSQTANTQRTTTTAATAPTSLSARTAAAAADAGIDLTNTTETHQHTTVAPAVTQEVVVPTVREIRTERITRDIHNTHVVHRVLPIRQVEHLPARHFVRTASGGLQEVEEKDVPGILGFA